MLRNAPHVAKAMMGPLYGAPLLQPQQVVDLVLKLLQEPLPVKGQSVPYAEEMAGAGCVHVLLQNGKVWDPFAVKAKSMTRGGGSGGGSSGRDGGGSVGGGSGRVDGSGGSIGGGSGGSGGRDGGNGSSSGGTSSAVTRYSPAALRAFAEVTAGQLPGSYRKLQVVRLSNSFREATALVGVQMPKVEGLPAGHVLVRRLFVGINASDINYTSGR
jgi:hypothetical protein